MSAIYCFPEISQVKEMYVSFQYINTALRQCVLTVQYICYNEVNYTTHLKHFQKSQIDLLPKG